MVPGITTCVCVSTTVRGGIEHNNRMILVRDAVAEVNHDTHEAELKIMDRLFADVKTTAEVVAMLAGAAKAIG
jgi:nicotinamidase-related amidase